MKKCLMLIAAAMVAAGAWATTTPTIVSSQVRANDPTILDVVYKVTSDKPSVKVRALAFEDGTRSFYNVIRPETFVNDPEGNPTAQNIGDAIAPNVEHKLAWKVSTDWKTDLAKCKFEILVSEEGQLPLDWITIPGTRGAPDITFSYNSQTAVNVLNAMYWYYANGEKDLVIDDGYLTTTNGHSLVNRNALGNQQNCSDYIANKMGLEVFGGTLFHYAVAARRKYFSTAYDSYCVKGMLNVTGSIYVGENAYCVIDISGGKSAASYPVAYLDSFPLEGWGNEYKTTKILLRRIEPGSVVLRGIKPVTLTKRYYIGVFEVTQKQYQLVTGSSPSLYKGDMRPVEKVSWNDIRGNSSTYDWPTVTTVDPSTFMGLLRSKTKLEFDLPTEAQWEYACKAGTTSQYNNGCSGMENIKLLGRSYANCDDGKGGFSEHTIVGCYFPNAFGLYDMHGNNLEWCLDWNTSLNSDATVDWVGPVSDWGRVERGGCWCYTSDSYRCRSTDREYNQPSSNSRASGFRLCLTLSNEE